MPKYYLAGGNMRYYYYVNIHKLMRQSFARMEGQIARTDFANPDQTKYLKEEFSSFVKMLEEHAAYEDRAFHPLLEGKEPKLLQQMETEHKTLENKLGSLETTLMAAMEEGISEEEMLSRGYTFYLGFTEYMGEYFKHLFVEEKEVMPALQRHYSDEELRAVIFNSYNNMLPEHILQMAIGVFPYLNLQGKQQFLLDVKDSNPQKFTQIWLDIWKMLNEHEQTYFLDKQHFNRP